MSSLNDLQHNVNSYLFNEFSPLFLYFSNRIIIATCFIVRCNVCYYMYIVTIKSDMTDYFSIFVKLASIHRFIEKSFV